MNKEKLIDIILKDIEELRDISEEIKKDGKGIQLEADIALSKAKLITQEIELLREKYISEKVISSTPDISFRNESNGPTEVLTSPHFQETKIEIEEEEKPAPAPKEELIVESETEEIQKEVSEENSHNEEENNFQEEIEIPIRQEEDDEFEEEEKEDRIEDEDDIHQQAENKTIGENFHSELSINDRLGQHNHSLDQKISQSPIISLNSSIGLNDRFLFIREIFDNNSEKYANAINQIDSCQNIKEAVDYLSSNFKIRKTETSLKFVELIKRRFAK